MTTDEFIKKQEAKLAEIMKDNKPLQIAVSSAMAAQSKRIFLDGKNKTGGEIGSYKGGELYVSPIKGFKKFPLKGKAGKDTFDNGNKHKSGYFKSYVDFKNIVGRQVGVKSVDLLLTGELQKDWANAPLGSPAKAVKVNPNYYYVSLTDLSMDKVSRYNGSNNKVFGLSVKEKADFLNVIQSELSKAMK